ncbi:MAG: hypothetical protein HY841_13945 [Bacteroidetes bacterium]|nr:hypothetical protein [Bacteroidota bacterium]
MNILQRNKKNVIIFLLLLFISILAYRNVFGILISTDFYPMLYFFEKYGLDAISNNFYEPGIQHFFVHLVFFFLYHIFGISNTGWIGFFVLVHCLNAFLLYKITNELCNIFLVVKKTLLSFFASLIFLLSPYQVEAVLWSFAYPFAVFLMLLGLLLTIYYLKENKIYFLVAVQICFALALLSFESTIILPVICFLFYFLFKNTPYRINSFYNYIFIVIFPQIIIIFLYFSMSKLYTGDWIGHYGAAVHLKFSPILIATNLIKYFVKFFLFYRFLPLERQSIIHDYLHINIHNTFTVLILIIFCAFIFSIFFWRIIKQRDSLGKLIVFTFFTFIISLIPVINLDTTFIGAIASDRYGYLPSVFFYSFFSFSIYYLLKRFWIIILTGLSALCFTLLSNILCVWIDASNYSKNLIKNFEPWLSKTNIYMLNMPDNYNWVFTFSGGFKEAIYFKYHKEIPPLNIISAYCMTSVSDSILIDRIDSNTLFVSSHNAQRAFLFGGRWLQSFKAKMYDVDINEASSSFTIRFNKLPDDATILYVAGDKWRELKL